MTDWLVQRPAPCKNCGHGSTFRRTAISVAALMWSSGAFAQDVPSADLPGEGEVAEPAIIVTGTRLSNPNFNAPTPVQSVSAENLETRAPAQIAEALNELPAFRISRGAQGTGRYAGDLGGVQATLDLRGLDAVRTLVLINGKRTVGTIANGTFDTNMIPVSLVDRVDVVTGGASAAYGSDAVAGVVNFILRNRLEGARATLQTGITSRGDGAQYLASIAAGTSFAEGRGHITFGGDVSRSEAVGNMYSRPFGRDEPALIDASQLGLTPAQQIAAGGANLFLNGVEFSTVSPGSLITARASDGNFYAFDPATGAPFRFSRPGTPALGNLFSMQGSTSNFGNNPNAGFPLKNANDRYVAYLRSEFAISDAITVYAEGNYGHTSMPRQQFGFFAEYPIQVQRARLPVEIRNLYSGVNVPIGRLFNETNGAQAEQNLDTYRLVAGLEGKLAESWKWQASFVHGRTYLDYRATGLVRSAYLNAIYGCDNRAANPNLTPALRAQLDIYEAATGKVCSNFSPFGVQDPNSPGAKYIYQEQVQRSRFGQDVASIGASGTPFRIGAEDATIALGAEWRRETLRARSDALGNAQLFTNGNFTDYRGKNNVKEVYAEIGVPLLRDLSFIHALDLNGAVRYTDYELSGGAMTWKAGATLEPLPGLKFRVTRSRDIRAPNLDELFLIGGTTTANLRNTIVGSTGFNGQSATPIRNGGNARLKPEIADTLTIGAVLQPEGALRGLRMSVDYYRINVKDVITLPTRAQTIALCGAALSGGATTCAGVEFDGTRPNGIGSVTNLYQNLDGLKVEGIDFEIFYQMSEPLGLPGRVSLRGLVNYAISNVQTTLNGAAERVGYMNGVPRWTGNVTVAYANGPFDLSFQMRGFSSLKYNSAAPSTAAGALAATCGALTLGYYGPGDDGYDPACPSSINLNRFAGRVYSNVNLTFRVSEKFELFGIVNNLFDRQPPAFGFIASTSSGNNALYDLIGRSYKAGVRLKF